MIIIAPDKFKGTLSASQAAEAIARGIRDAGYSGRILQCPMADGGDGTAGVLTPLLSAESHVVESHLHIGPECFGALPPMKRSSYAFGHAIAVALQNHTHVYAAIGGTACCDGGAGMLQALGMQALHADGSIMTEPLTPYTLPSVARVDCSALAGIGQRITVLADVRASLVPDPASRLSALDFCVQKGFSEADMHVLSGALKHWLDVASPMTSNAVDGAGGGAGFALASMLCSEVCAGAHFVADCYDMPLQDAQLVVSGEGCIDAQTGSGKVVAEMARRAAEACVPFLAIGGCVRGEHAFPTLAVDSPGTRPPATAEEAAFRLQRAVAERTGHVFKESVPHFRI